MCFVNNSGVLNRPSPVDKYTFESSLDINYSIRIKLLWPNVRNDRCKGE